MMELYYKFPQEGPSPLDEKQALFVPLNGSLTIQTFDALQPAMRTWLKENPTPLDELWGTYGIWFPKSSFFDALRTDIYNNCKYYLRRYSPVEIEEDFKLLEDLTKTDELLFYVF